MTQHWEDELRDEAEQATAEQIEQLRQKRAARRKREKTKRALIVAAAVLIISLLLAASGMAVWRFYRGQDAQPEQPAIDEVETEIAAEPEEPQTPEPEQTEELPEEKPAEETPEQQEEETKLPEVPADTEQEEVTDPDTPAYLKELEKKHVYQLAQAAENTKTLDLELYSESAILIDVATNTVIAEKNADSRIYPASMTKVMTALVASENIENWDDTFTMRQSIIDPYFIEGASMAGYVANEEVTMQDLLIGAVAPSGAEATFALAEVIAGSEEAYAELMNRKAAELGLTDSHFMNTSGLHNAEHYTTVRDMAVILLAAIDDPHCREALSMIEYRSQPTQQHPDGFVMVNKFNSRIHDRDLGGGAVLGSKTGYTADAMNCCASFGYLPDGRLVICVTAHAWTGDFCIEDHIALYSKYNGIE
ncbi:MAG: serine hydrolase [Clostridia bacterium]|nr:serine hydrolase [Clostridia bacterium]